MDNYRTHFTFSQVDEGWATARLGDFCFGISSGKDKISDNGQFDLYGSTGIIGKTEIASYKGNYILIARVGANAGLLNRVNGMFGVTDNTLLIDLKNVELIDYILYFLETIGLNKLVFGSGQPLITGGQLKNLIIHYPLSIIHSSKIASCLSSLDEVIAAHSQKLDFLKDHKKGLMQKLFPQTGEKSPKYRFPEFRNDGRWVETKLGEVCRMQAGKFVSASAINAQFMKDFYPCYGGNGLRGYTKSFTHSGTYSLIGRQGALCVNVTLANNKFHATEHAVVVTPEIRIDNIWLFYVLELLNLNQHATGQAQPGLSVTTLEQIKLYTPVNFKEQQKIASCLSSLDALIAAQSEKIEQLKLQKKGLMQGLFPGIN
jgi:type I restriction enzyme S subunit